MAGSMRRAPGGNLCAGALQMDLLATHQELPHSQATGIQSSLHSSLAAYTAG